MSRAPLSIRLLPICLAALCLSSQAFAEAPAAPTSAPTTPTEPAVDVNRASYGVGLTFGAQLRAAGVTDDVSMDSLEQGIKAGMTGTAASPADQQQVMNWVRAGQSKIQARNERTAHEFLGKNGQVTGVVTTASGLQYKVLNAGDSTAASPKATDRVVVNYSGQLLDGTEFDSSYKRGQPAAFPVGGVIKGWTEALQLMKPGAKWELYIPADLAYGNTPPRGSPFEPGMMLKFDVELLKVLPSPVATTAAPKRLPATGATAKPAIPATAPTKKPPAISAPNSASAGK
jgi:FKBP-type peptidyl-prolyl cis-trans isomerase FklB